MLLPQSGHDTVAVIRTPAWEFRSVGLESEDLSYDDAGTVSVRTDTACVAMRGFGPFETVDGALCTLMTELGSYARPVQGFRLKPAEWLYQAAGQRLRLLLSRGACT